MLYLVDTQLLSLLQSVTNACVMLRNRVYLMYKQSKEITLIMLYTKRDQMSRDLLYLVKEDDELLSDIIYNYCQLIPNKQFNDLEDVINTKVREII